MPRAQVDPESAIARSTGNAVVFRWESDAHVLPALEDGGSLSLAEAIRRAVETSSELQIALARVRTAQAEADLAALLPNPVLSFVFRLPEGGGAPELEASLASELLAYLERPRRTSVAGHRLQAEAARSVVTALDVVLDAKQRYAAVQSGEALLPVLEEGVAVLERVRDIARARLDLGEGTRLDVTTLDAEHAGLSAAIVARRHAVRIAHLALAQAIGEPAAAAEWTLEPWSAPAHVPASDDLWIESALAHRPEILALERELAAREDEEHLARKQIFASSSVGLDAERDGDWSVGPSFSTALPLFDDGSARAERARAHGAEGRHRLERERRLVIEDVRVALAALAGAQESLERIDGEVLPLQVRRRAEIDAAYRLGLADVTALLVAAQAFQETQAERIELAHDVLAAQLRVERAVGGPAVFSSIAHRSRGAVQP